MKDRQFQGHITQMPPKPPNLQFQGVTLHGKDHRNYSPIDSEAFYRILKESIESKLLDSKNAYLTALARVLDGKHWPQDINSQLAFVENELENCQLGFS